MLPLLAIFSPAKLILGGALIMAALGAWGMWTYRGMKIERLEATVAAREAEIKSVADTANQNAAALASVKADWARADALVAQRDRELRNANSKVAAAQRAARAVPAGQCAAPGALLAFAGKLRGPTDAADSPQGRTGARDAPRPVAKPRVP